MAFEDVQNSEPTIDEMFDSVVDDQNGVEEQAEAPAPAQKQEAEPEFEYTALGATRKEPLSTILKRASMGYDYAQKMDAFKQQQAEVERIRAEAEARHQKFAHLDEYAQKNPEWYQHWSQAYEQRQTGMNQTQEDPTAFIAPIKEELNSARPV